MSPDTRSYNDAFTDINDSLVALGNWSGTQPTTWVSPYFGAILDTSLQAIEDCHIVAGLYEAQA